MLKAITKIGNEEEIYSRRHIYTYGDGPILEFDGETYSRDKPLFFVPEKHRDTPFDLIRIRNARFIPDNFDQLVRYAGEIHVDNSIVVTQGKIPKKILL